MLSYNLQVGRVLVLLTGLGLLSLSSSAQVTTPAPAPVPSDEVVRITTELVQTDVMVFDRQGKFVDGLKADQFDLRVDGSPQTIAFFELVRSGTVNEESQLAAARGGATRREGEAVGPVKPLDRGRTIFFFVDDIHLSPGSLTRVRQTLLRFIDTELGQNDEAAIVSATGQLGFLQQLTGEKIVLRAAASRLNPKLFNVRDGQSPPMSQAHALAIERNDSSVLNYFIEALQRDTPLLSPQNAEMMVEQRARSILSQTNYYTDSTLIALESLVRGCAPLPGRKVIVFISDGFLLDVRDGSLRGRVQNLTDAAARSGVVIYSVGAQGLTSGMRDASSDAPFDPRLTSVDLSELSSTQASLHTLAAETGGRALINTNALDAALEKAVEETSVYYLLAWKPSGLQANSSKLRRIEASVRGRPELNVIIRRGFFDSPRPELPPASAKKNKAKAPNPAPTPSPDRELYAALKSRHPVTSLPASLALGFVSTPAHGAVLTASLGIDRDVLKGNAPDARGGSRIDIAGAVYNDKGDAISAFKQEMVVPFASSPEGRHLALYTHSFRVAAGLYQVRIAALDRQTGRAGSASQWVEIPTLSGGQFSMSSLFVGERPSSGEGSAASPSGGSTPSAAPPESTVLLSVDRRFARNSAMRFVTYIYNARSGTTAQPDVALQVQIFRDDQPVFTAPMAKVKTTEVPDLTRIPYAAELSLTSFPAGRYVLQVTVIDRAARASASQRVNFVID